MAPDIDSRRNRDSLALRWSGRLSLTWRILAVNILALALLAGGFFYIDSYRARLIDSRLAQNAREVTLLSDAIANSPPERERDQMLAFAARTDVRVRMYGTDGKKIFDSSRDGGPPFDLVDPRQEALKRHLARGLDKMVDAVVGAEDLPVYIEPRDDRAAAWPELVAARQKDRPAKKARYAPDRTPLLSAAVTLPDGRSLLTSENDRNITKVVRAERLDLSLVLASAMLASVLLSLFLSRTIVQPLQRLADAAVRVRLGRARQVSIPLLPDRRDEIGTLARAISDMTQSLRRRIDATDAFAADVSHELKNPIASLRSALDGLDHVQQPELREKLLAIARDDVRRIDRLVSDIAEASRIDGQLSRTRFVSVDLGELIENMVLTRESRGIERQVKLVFGRPRRDVAVVMGEPQRLAMVIDNLIDNAISFSPDKGLVQITATEAENEVLISVEDMGPGVSESEREAIFRRFHSLRPETEGFGKHSGLGLAIAQSVVDAHQGRIFVTDRPDGLSGARFEVHLPLGHLHDPGLAS